MGVNRPIVRKRGWILPYHKTSMPGHIGCQFKSRPNPVPGRLPFGGSSRMHGNESGIDLFSCTFDVGVCRAKIDYCCLMLLMLSV